MRALKRAVLALGAALGLVFASPASAETVQYIEKLADLGVHVVFVTPRAEKGANSAEEILPSKLRTRAGNPVMVVSYNGARIALPSGAGPNSIVLPSARPNSTPKTEAELIRSA